MWLDWLVFCEYGFSVSALWCPLATPTILLGFLLSWAWDIYSRLPQQSVATAPYSWWSSHHCQKTVWNAVPGCSLKNDRVISVRFQGKPFIITIIQVCAPTSNAEEAEVEQFCEDLQDLLELTPEKDVLFIIGDWNAKVGSQEIPGITGKFGLEVQNEAGWRLTEFCQEHTGHSKHPLPTTQEKILHMDITRWSVPKSDWLCSLQAKMEKLYTVSKNKTWSWLWLRSWAHYCKIKT